MQSKGFEQLDFGRVFRDDSCLLTKVLINASCERNNHCLHFVLKNFKRRGKPKMKMFFSELVYVPFSSILNS